MSFAVSPGVTVREFDVTNIVPAVDASVGAYAGVFRWGPIGVPVLVDSEAALVSRFGRPTNLNAEGWFSAASFLSYSNALLVSRAANTSSSNGAQSALNAVGNTANVANLATQVVKNEQHYESKVFSAGVHYVAKWPGEIGNSIKVSVVDSASQFESTIDLANVAAGAVFAMSSGSNTATITIAAANSTEANTAGAAFGAGLVVSDLYKVGNSTIGYQYLKLSGVNVAEATGNSSVGESEITLSFESELRLFSNVSIDTEITRRWEFWDLMDSAPGQSAWQSANGNTAANDEVHVVIVDAGGKFTGSPGTVLEVYKGLSRSTDARTADNLTNYYKDAINQRSQYVWWAGDRTGAVSAAGSSLASSSATAPMVLRFTGGADGAAEDTISIGELANAYDVFKDDAKIADVGLIVMGKARGGTAGGQLANYVIDNICEVRKDCVAFISPDKADVVNNVGNEAADVVAFRNTLRSTSYGFLDSGYKYMYDRYNDVYRYVPLNGDMAGLAARTDATNDAWWSPAGFNRGNVKNLVRLAWNPAKAERDQLYKAGVNPVVSFDGLGTVLYGDKTLLAKPSAFDRINVRRLFIVLEKAIATAAKFQLFEFNDDFTRAMFRNMVNPYLRDVKGRRGITDFLVVADETNNTGQVIDANEFRGAIYIKPARSISYITLDFVAVGTSVSFSEIIGRYGG